MTDAGGPPVGAAPAPMGVQTVSLLRKVIVGIIIGSFGLAALGGIAVLLGGDFGPAAGRVLGTTAVVGAFSVAVLCCVALAGRRLQVLGTIGAAVSIATAALTIFMIWSDFDQSPPDVLLADPVDGHRRHRGARAGLTPPAAGRPPPPAVRVGLWITLALFAAVVAMVLYLIWFPDDVDDDVFPRALGIARHPRGPRGGRRPGAVAAVPRSGARGRRSPRPAPRASRRTPPRVFGRRHPVAGSRSISSSWISLGTACRNPAIRRRRPALVRHLRSSPWMPFACPRPHRSESTARVAG